MAAAPRMLAQVRDKRKTAALSAAVPGLFP